LTATANLVPNWEKWCVGTLSGIERLRKTVNFDFGGFMTREEQRRFKELGKSLSEAKKVLSKKYGFSSSHSYVFRFVGEFVYWSSCYVEQNMLNIAGHIYVKSLKLNEVFWDVFEIPENRKQPKSFHVWGAFTSPFFVLPEQFAVDIGAGNVASAYESYLHQANLTIDNYAEKLKTVSDIMPLFENNPYHQLNIVLAKIYEGQYQTALSMIEKSIANGEHGGFSCGDRSIYDYAKAYCEQRI